MWGYKKTNFKAGFWKPDRTSFRLAQKIQAPLKCVPIKRIDFREWLLKSNDQGQTPHCAAFACDGVAEFYNWLSEHIPAQLDSHRTYEEAKEEDSDRNDGTTFEYVFKAQKKLGSFKQGKYELVYVGSTIRDFMFAMQEYRCPLIGGLNITDEWNYVNKKTGFIADFGDTAKYIGGHGIIHPGYEFDLNPKTDGPYIQNSWSDEWGVHGFARMTWTQFERQLMYAVAIIKVK